jgi:Uncharacterized protein conserved in bacteria
MEQNNEMSAQQSLQIITETFNKSRKGILRNSAKYFLLWGALLTAISLVIYLLWNLTGKPQWNFLWFAMPAIGYPPAGIAGEFGYLNIGVGYTIPFQTFAAPWIDADKLKERLDSYEIPGTAFRTIHYKPISGQNPQMQHGVQFFYTDYEAATITLTQFYVMQALQELYPDRNPYKNLKKTRMLDIVCGTDYVRREFGKRLKVADIESWWTKDVEDFKELSRNYYLYR